MATQFEKQQAQPVAQGPRLVIVFPYAFGTGWAGATPRTMSVGRGLSKLGWNVSLVRCRQPKEAALKPLIKDFPGRVITASFNGLYPGIFNHMGLRRAFDQCRRVMGRVNAEEDYDPADVMAERFVRLARRDRAFPTPDLILGITVGALAGPLSAQRLSAHFGCPFVLEFRDPIPHPGRAPLSRERRLMFESCLSAAKMIITTTAGISELIRREFAIVGTKVRTVYSGYDNDFKAATPSKLNQEPFVLVHAGVLYGGQERNACSLVRAIAEAVRVDDSLRMGIKLKLIGAGAGGREAVHLAAELGISWAVESLPQMATQACLEEMDRADMLVVIKFESAQYDLQVPGKLFQCLGRGKPILCLMRETEASAIARRSGLGIILANRDIPGISAALLDLCRNRGSLGQRFKADWQYIQQFSATAMAENFDRDLKALLNEQPAELQPAL